MKSRDTLVRLKRFQTEEKRRQYLQIETMIAEFERMAHDLDREIATEQQRAGISDPNHFAYPTYARAAATRRDNLRASAGELAQQLDDARTAYEAALDELKKVEALGERERGLDAIELPARSGGGRLRVSASA